MHLLLLALALAAAPAGVDLKKVTAHLHDHQTYPATRAELITACYNLEDFSPVEKKWFIQKVPNKKFSSADEVVAAITR